MSVKAIGRGYPVPKGARDIYSYDVKGIAQNISLDITDNRSTQQRLTDRFDNAGRMLTQGIGNGYRRATEYNPALNKLGNAAEAINGSADIIKNVIGAAGEIIGAGDAVQGIGAGIDIATMHGLDLLSTENKIKAVSNWVVCRNSRTMPQKLSVIGRSETRMRHKEQKHLVISPKRLSLLPKGRNMLEPDTTGVV